MTLEAALSLSTYYGTHACLHEPRSASINLNVPAAIVSTSAVAIQQTSSRCATDDVMFLWPLIPCVAQCPVCEVLLLADVILLTSVHS